MNDNDQNPFESPSTSASIQPQLVTQLSHAEIVQKFRQQIHALGAFWIIIGTLALGLAVAAVAMSNGNRVSSQETWLLGVVATCGLAWVVLGALSCMKKMWAVYAGLGLSYLSVIMQVFTLNVCGIIIGILVILQAHRVIGWASKLNDAGVPLTTKA